MRPPGIYHVLNVARDYASSVTHHRGPHYAAALYRAAQWSEAAMLRPGTRSTVWRDLHSEVRSAYIAAAAVLGLEGR